jgi:outer membrane receptor for ferrienterochelin and colicin
MKKLYTIYLMAVLAFVITSCAGSGGSAVPNKSSEKDYSQYTTLAQALRSVPGILVSGTLSNPVITLRGGGSGGINNIQPLFVIDNVSIGRSYEQANNLAAPDNIKSIRALNGLAATNRYGQEGAGGVILITTKSGSTR